MGISFKGHTPNFQIWVFDLDGKRFVARNLSTPQPLNIKFAGFFDDAPLAQPLVKTSGFDILESGVRNVVWLWNGQKYISSYDVDDSDPEGTGIVVYFSSPAPYSGPAVSPVGTAGVKTKDEREAAEAAAAPAAITPSAQLSTAAPTPQSPEPAKVTVSPTGPNLQFSNKTKEDVEASTAYQTYDYSNRTPVQPPAPQTPVGITRSPVLIPGTKDAREAAAAPATTDWVKLGLQLGAAYLLLS